MASFNISKTPNGKYQFFLKTGKGEVLLTSEEYNSKDAVMHVITSVKSNSLRKDRYLKHDTKNGGLYFNLLAANGNVLGTSQLYTGITDWNKETERIREIAIRADIQDETSEESSFTKKTAQFVKEKRKQMGLTQEDLAFKAGVGVRFISELESGEKETLRTDKVNEVLKLFGYELGPVKIKRS